MATISGSGRKPENLPAAKDAVANKSAEVDHSAQRTSSAPAARDVREPRDALKNQRMTPRPANAPTNCATMNIGTSAGAIPEKLLVSARAIVTAGLANDVEAVNQ